MTRNQTLAREHAKAIAAAISNYMSAQNTAYPNRTNACAAAYLTLTERIEAALDYASIGEVGA